MFLRQSELFNGMSMELIRKVMDLAERIHCDQGQTLFHRGERPDRFYILIHGRVQLTFGQKDQQVYVGSQPGEFFGWSGLLEQDSFTASGECLEPTDMLKIDTAKIFSLLRSDPEGTCLLYKNLCRALGSRLLHVYEFFTEARA
jgi:CRP-like cAMP-binding protein